LRSLTASEQLEVVIDLLSTEAVKVKPGVPVLLEGAGPLGDAYRVEARVVLWSGDDVLKVPVSALFRHGENWCVFVVEGGRARLREVEIGHRGSLEVEIAKGLSAGEKVVRHPSNDVGDVGEFE
jgi:hypothetical protein